MDKSCLISIIQAAAGGLMGCFLGTLWLYAPTTEHPFIATAYLSIRHVSIVHLVSYFYFQQGSTLYYKPQNSHQISAQLGCAGTGGWMILCQCGPTFMRKIYNFYTNCFVFSVTIVQHSMFACLTSDSESLTKSYHISPNRVPRNTENFNFSSLLLNCHFLFAFSLLIFSIFIFHSSHCSYFCSVDVFLTWWKIKLPWFPL